MSLADTSSILSQLEDAGFTAYIVGGAVRDMQLGHEPKDYDITTDANVSQMRKVFKKSHIISYAEQFGTIVIRRGGHSYEITMFRTEGSYRDGRHPDEILLASSIEEDLARRDFTINAMAMDRQQHIIDPFDGKADLSAQLVRCVGEPIERFSEDFLRMLRAVRFACQLGFDIESRTKDAIIEIQTGKHAGSLMAMISKERIAEELRKMLGYDARRAILLLEELQLLEIIKPLADIKSFQLQQACQQVSMLEHVLQCLKQQPSDPLVGMAIIGHDLGKPSCKAVEHERVVYPNHERISAQLMDTYLHDLRLSNHDIQHVLALISFHLLPLNFRELTYKPPSLRRWLKRLQKAYQPSNPHRIDAVRHLMEVVTADCYSRDVTTDQLETFATDADKVWQEMLQQKPVSVISGHVLKQLGLQGKQIGMMLTELEFVGCINEHQVVNHIKQWQAGAPAEWFDENVLRNIIAEGVPERTPEEDREIQRQLHRRQRLQELLHD